MAYPTDLPTHDDFIASETLAAAEHAAKHNAVFDELEALEAKVGVNSSAVTTSHDYKLSGVTGTDKAVSKTGIETLTNKTLTAPSIADFTNANHDHSVASKGGTIPEASVVFGATGHEHTGTTSGNLIPTAGIENAAITGVKLAAELIGSQTAALRIKLPIIVQNDTQQSGSGWLAMAGSWIYLDPADWAISGKTTKIRIWCAIERQVVTDVISLDIYDVETSAELTNMICTTDGTGSTTILAGSGAANVFMRSREGNFPTSGRRCYVRITNGTSATNWVKATYAFLEIYWV